MTLRALFEREVFVRLTDEGSAFICTTRRPLFAKVFSKVRRIAVDESARDRALKVRAGRSMASELPMLRRHY